MASNITPPSGLTAQQSQNQQNGQSSATPQQPPASPPKKSTRIGFSGKTLWDWLNLLGVFLIPLMIGVFTIASSIQQSNSSQQQHNTDIQIALDQQRAAILQTYIDNIQDLLLNHHLLESNTFNPSSPYYDVAVLARARTLTALQDLDPERKGRLVQFIYTANLIGFLNPGTDPTKGRLEPPIIGLPGANLSDAILYIKFGNASPYADFNGANFEEANLNNANLFHIFLSRANLTGADLTDAVLSDDYLFGADLTDAVLSGADLSNADLQGANLTGANLNNANLTYAYLNKANLSNTDLTQQQLDQVYSCRGALLPKGLTCHHQSP